ncbi:hypothetical protein GCM10009737_04130 [Nocardioides lentus]|uniref:Alkaline shock response membrane anchor protein AmaP n=1 Tax=Nocardioides lentus TaxID=338077 RepID=A0ABP5A866_9ACTN
MTRKLNAFDRTVTLVLALGLGAGAFFALDWRYGWVFTYADELSTQPATTVVESSWFPWVFAVVGLVLGLLGLWWLLSHTRRPHESTLRLRGSGGAGRLELDLSSMADATADRFATLTPTDHVRGRTRSYGSKQVVEIKARLASRADGPSIAAAARTCAEDVARALPDGDATCRVLVDGPSRRPSLGRRSTTARVH